MAWPGYSSWQMRPGEPGGREGLFCFNLTGTENVVDGWTNAGIDDVDERSRQCLTL